jgi:hypothetical protein
MQPVLVRSRVAYREGEAGDTPKGPYSTHLSFLAEKWSNFS